MTPDKAYDEALRRIREAEKTGALELVLRGLETLNRLPPELARLTSLQSLNLSFCKSLRGDLSPLAGLTLLRVLDLSGCERLSGDLSPLAAPHLAPISQPRHVPAAQWRPVSANTPHLAPIAQPVLLWRSPVCSGRILVAYVENTLPVRLRAG
jgi:hypothetical protein